MTDPRLALGILASGEGLTFEGLAVASESGRLPARLAFLLTDRPGAPVLARARAHGTPCLALPRRGLPVADWAEQADQALREAGVQLLVLAGFLSILPGEFLARWSGRAINLHPSLLPKYGGRGFYGPRVLSAALEAGDRETGVTVHLVTGEIDRGTILVQRRLSIEPGEGPTHLHERLRPLELEALVSVIERFADGTFPLPFRPGPPDGTGGDRSGALA
ncbi:MAG: phosphoribosylglycinamide formyltransferase [Thermoplasmata archaeon]